MDQEQQRNIEIAEANEVWQQIKASFALEGIELDDDNAALAGRLISGEITLDQALAELRRSYGGTANPVH